MTATTATVSKSSQKQPKAAKSSQKQPKAAKNSQKQQKAAKSSQKLPKAAKSSQKQPTQDTIATGANTRHNNHSSKTSRDS
jgi:hypothetical protein